MQALSHAGCLCDRLCQQTLVPKNILPLRVFTWTFKLNGFYFKTAVIFHFKTKQGRKWNKHFFLVRVSVISLSVSRGWLFHHTAGNLHGEGMQAPQYCGLLWELPLVRASTKCSCVVILPSQFVFFFSSLSQPVECITFVEFICNCQKDLTSHCLKLTWCI